MQGTPLQHLLHRKPDTQCVAPAYDDSMWVISQQYHCHTPYTTDSIAPLLQHHAGCVDCAGTPLVTAAPTTQGIAQPTRDRLLPA